VLLFLRYNKITIVFSIVIIVLCGFPGDKMPSLDIMGLFSFDKVAHMFCFGTLTVFASGGLVKYLHFSFLRKQALNWAIAYSVFLGGATEVAQAFLAIHRTGDWIDFFADCIGIALGALVFLFIYTRQPLKI
jgi:VanZ family protein